MIFLLGVWPGIRPFELITFFDHLEQPLFGSFLPLGRGLVEMRPDFFCQVPFLSNVSLVFQLPMLYGRSGTTLVAFALRRRPPSLKTF